MPGSAHFLEHMLFMGSGKFQGEDEYSEFITNHGGSNNAYTREDLTNYYFEISPDSLAGALERLDYFE